MTHLYDAYVLRIWEGDETSLREYVYSEPIRFDRFEPSLAIFFGLAADLLIQLCASLFRGCSNRGSTTDVDPGSIPESLDDLFPIVIQSMPGDEHVALSFD